MAPRVTYRKRSSYHTLSNATRVVKTPGQLNGDARRLDELMETRPPLLLLSVEAPARRHRPYFA